MPVRPSTRSRLRIHPSLDPLVAEPDRRPAPVRSEAEALRIFQLAAAAPIEHETLAFFLDAEGVGGVITVVSGTFEHDAVLAVVDVFARAAAMAPRPLALVVATMRPDEGVVPDDCDRWFALSDLVADHGALLLDWFVIDPDGAASVRAVSGEPDRWRAVTPGE